ncbi:vang-like protein 1 [Spea bombifrons]|uniref:vang-like protein 1 n=1 Tax=Spea bombifrons TaxID=233779 RepID=UPI00234BDABF|nr:vang-like protein 1 [Spea bombifrons]
MDTESNYSGYSFHSRLGHQREKSRDGQKSVTIQTPAGEPLLSGSSKQREDEEDGQDDNWAETTTAVTSEHSASLQDLAQTGGPGEPEGAGPTARTLLGFYAFCLLAALALLTPPAFITLPLILWGSELEHCGVSCEGLYISVAFKLLLLAVGSWAVFLRRPRSSLPRMVEFRAVLLLLLFLLLASYWLFYGVRVLGQRERNLLGVVQYTASLVDALIFIHYLAVILLELRQLQPVFALKVIRAGDGEARFYSLGKLSVQRAALFVLKNYYKDFPIFNPSYAAAKKLTKQPQHSKVYSVDGPDNSTVSKSQALVASSSGYKEYKERYYEEAEHARKVRKRKARLVISVHEAFCQLQRLGEQGNEGKSRHELQPREAAQSIFPLIAQSLQRYLRTTRQAHLYSMESIIQHLTMCLTHNMSPQAFLEQYLKPGPAIQYQTVPTGLWTLVSEEPVTRPIRPNLTFCLQSSDSTLVVSVTEIPSLRLSETFIPPNSHRFTVRTKADINL